jgi:hypothetical protein
MELEKSTDQVLPGSDVGQRVEAGCGGRNDLNNVCTVEYMNNNNNKGMKMKKKD